MSFWTGFATGLAKSVDTSLKNAMDKRDQELSKAKTFWQQRQAQKLDQKEAYDERAEKALRRMIREAGDDVELGLAAFNAAGGDPDSVEALIKRIDDTRANKGTYNLLDSLKDADGNPLKSSGASRNIDDAVASVRKELKAVDPSLIKIDSPLENTIFKLKGGAAERTAESINAMIPPEKVEQITGIPVATLDMSNMLEAEKYAQNQKLIAKQLTPTLAEANASIVQEIMELDPTSATFADDSAKLIEKQNTILTAIGQEAQAKDTGGQGSLTVSGLNTMYQNQLSAYLVAKGINTKEQAYTDEGGTVYGDGKGFMAALAKHQKEFDSKFISTIRRSDGSFGPAAASLIGNNINLQSIASGMAAADGNTTDASLQTGDTPEEPTIDWSQKSTVVADPAGFADHAYKTRPNITADRIYAILTKSGVDPESASEQAERIYALQEAEREAAANAPKYVPGKGLVSPDDDSNNVPPKYQGPGGYARKAKWDSMYGATHNPDGTPK
tara:strand:+ start:201 stop:1703 length:1503 start_codon:yes stop_codon:yes gene_type:complete